MSGDCSINKDRPCGTKNREKNRYTRAELEKIAEKCGIKDMKKKTMDELCQLIREKSKKEPSLIQTIFEPIPEKISEPKPPKKPEVMKLTKTYNASDISDAYNIYELKNLNDNNFSMDKLINTYKYYLRQPITFLDKVRKIFNVPKNQKKKMVDDIFYHVVKNIKFSKDFLKKMSYTDLFQICEFLHIETGFITNKYTLVDIILKEISSTPKPVVNKPCSKTSPNAYRPNYTCNPATGKWTRISGSNEYYFKKELEKMHQDGLKQIASGYGLKNTTISKSQLISYILEAQYPLVASKYSQSELDHADINKLIQISNSYNIVLDPVSSTKKDYIYAIIRKQNPAKYNKYVKKFKEYLSIKKSTPIKPKTTTFIIDINRANILSSNTADKIQQQKFFYITSRYTLTGSFTRNKLSIDNDLLGLQMNGPWFENQIRYQKQLPFNDQLFILAYTYGGDQILHSWIGKTFDIKKVFIPDNYTNGRYMFPLFPAYVKFCSDMNNKDKFRNYFKFGAYQPLYWTQSHNNPYMYYKEIVENIFHRYMMKDVFYSDIIEIFYHELNRIILKSPPLEHSLIVYKGIKTSDFLQFDKDNIYKNERFISTSYNRPSAMHGSFINNITECCMLKIFLTKGTRCLLPIFSYFLEYEILLPTKRYLYTTSSFSKRHSKMGSISTMNIVVAN